MNWMPIEGLDSLEEKVLLDVEMDPERHMRYCGGCGEFLYDFEHFIVEKTSEGTTFTPSGFCCDCHAE